MEIEKDPDYERIGDDLIMKKEIKLIDSLKGFKFNIKHINDQNITIETPPGKIT